ncbi:NACHT domain protein, partial [Rhizoctonia solani AG-3 Rhs1AP]
MPLRKKVKETLKQPYRAAAEDLRAEGEGGTRPKTPAPDPDSLAVVEQASDPGTDLPKTSPHDKIATDPSDEPQPKDMAIVDNDFRGSAALTRTIQDDRAGVDIGSREFNSDIATPIVPGLSELPALAVGLTNMASSNIDADVSGVTESQKFATISPMVPDAPSANWKGLKQFARVLEPVSNLFGPIKEAMDLFTECADKCEMTGVAKVEYEELRVRLEGIFEDLNGYFGKENSLTMTSSMENLCRSIQASSTTSRSNKTETSASATSQQRTSLTRFWLAIDESKGIYSDFCLELNANLSMWRVAQEQAANSRIDRMSSFVDRLPSSLPAWYDSAEGIELKRRGCTPGTRVNVLATMLDWARTGGGGVYWLNGMAGTGKTTIAYTVCADLDSRRQLGASFFCSRLREECRNVNAIIPSIAYQLARFSRPYLFALSTVLEKDPDVHGRLPHMQFDALIAKPMLEVQHTLPEELIVVIDALDECEQKESTARMLDVLLSKSGNLPVKFIVSSRPESQIHDQMSSKRTRSQLVLHELDKGEVQADIEKYLRKGLAQMGPSEAQLAGLVRKSGILFIYAATAVRYIGYDNFHSDPHDSCGPFLPHFSQRRRENEEIDQLYITV